MFVKFFSSIHSFSISPKTGLNQTKIATAQTKIAVFHGLKNSNSVTLELSGQSASKCLHIRIKKLNNISQACPVLCTGSQ